ncbi:hypothetical protein O181_010994 [Austropuccinia psidii MF-1]|uniref:Tyrosine--tRNA ligase n=1 Tax=Austropuccinia psidii MF-1 TaxID=1389203 RepID=A0A9Q3GLF3_9BASI|nr:hypothetical protein [Austropuccinia psidii MF-1]
MRTLANHPGLFNCLDPCGRLRLPRIGALRPNLRLSSHLPSHGIIRSASRQVNGDVVQELEDRGSIAQVTSRAIRQHLQDSRTVYLGIDPTAKSLHVGNLLPLVALLRFALKGHHTIVLLGGATGSVGDPSGRDSERVALSSSTLESNLSSISHQITRLISSSLAHAVGLQNADNHSSPSHCSPPAIKNNLEWTKDITLLDFLSSVGKKARISSMLARDSVKQRLESGTGISFTEFTYQLLQAHDFSELHLRYDCSVQIGGSDQYGNIMSGIELITRAQTLSSSGQNYSNSGSLHVAYGLTTPLLTTAKGEKFGKSAGNAIWLDPELTPPVDLYQAFLSIPDSEVLKYLKLLTFVSLKEIMNLSVENIHRDKREAQKRLAQEITLMIHGPDGLRKALLATKFLFPTINQSMEWGRCQLDDAFGNSPNRVMLTFDKVLNQRIENLAVASGLCKSKGEARTLLQNGAITLNHTTAYERQMVAEADLVDSHYILLMRGKTAYKLTSKVVRKTFQALSCPLCSRDAAVTEVSMYIRNQDFVQFTCKEEFVHHDDMLHISCR